MPMTLSPHDPAGLRPVRSGPPSASSLAGGGGGARAEFAGLDAAQRAETLFRPGIARAGLHEIYAASAADAAAATGFALGNIGQWLAARAELAARAARDPRRLAGAGPAAAGASGGPLILWVRQGHLHLEGGRISAAGLAEFGLPPAQVALVAAQDLQGVLQAGLEAARCPALLAALVEVPAASRLYDLVASRRLTRAAKEAGVGLFLLRQGAGVVPSAAESRWRIESLPSRPLAANATGHPAFRASLLRHRGGREGQEWQVEWRRDDHRFKNRDDSPATRGDPVGAALSGAVVPLPAARPAAGGWRA